MTTSAQYNQQLKNLLPFILSHLHKAEWNKNQNTDILHSLTKTTKSLNMQQIKN